MKTPAILIALVALGACSTQGTPYQAPPKEASATLRVDAPDITGMRIYTDGEHCRGALSLPADVDPLRRADRTMSIPVSDQPIAISLRWPHKYLSDCKAIVQFKPVAGGVYRVSATEYVDRCEAVVEAIPGTHTAPIATMPMRPWVMPSEECVPEYTQNPT
jgi:hypothetical protein